MRQFGSTIDKRLQGTMLPRVADGESIGNVFYSGMKGALDYLRNGQQKQDDAYLPSDQALMGSRATGDIAMRDSVVERQAPPMMGGGGNGAMRMWN